MDTESANAQDARVDALWASLDTHGQGQLDLTALRKGLRKLDHPLKNADDLLAEVFKNVDTSGDGRIQYQEFRDFVKHTEKELLDLFRSIDYNNDGKISKPELRAAFSRAGLAVPSSKLDAFFVEVDSNHDGSISYEGKPVVLSLSKEIAKQPRMAPDVPPTSEPKTRSLMRSKTSAITDETARDFLLFIPAAAPNLKAIISYFQATMKLNAEGDVQIDHTVQGLGGYMIFLLHVLFGSIFLVARAPSSPSHWSESETDAALPDVSAPAMSQTLPPRSEIDIHIPIVEVHKGISQGVISVLIACVPNPGYFVAGGIAGIVSRTSTAPLDRLKVYLIAQTSVKEEAVSAAKSGNVIRAALSAWKPLWYATRELWQAGGMRSLYAGNGLNVVKVMPESAIKFGAYEASKRAFAKLEGHDDPTHIHSWSKFVSGGIGGMISQFAVYPIDTLKFRMQCETVSGGLHGNQLIIATAKKMWQTGGFVAYYRGLPMGLIGIFPYAALDLGTFEYLKRAVTTRNAKKRGCHEEDAEPGGVMTAAIGGFSGAFGASAVYPLNLLRTRLQSQGTVLHPRTYTGIMDVTRQTIEGEGVRGLFKGLTPNLLKVVPAVSITYVVYDKSKKALGLH